MSDIFKLLDHINLPDDLRKLKKEDLLEVCKELRQFIINEVSANPGHFGASLGVVELTVALHYVFNTPYDRIIWDVGHQAYGHKILTGRKELFKSNRQLGGLCGFPTPRESEYDSFGVGHSSTSISAGLGMAIASQLQGTERQVVAVIGDGAMTGGMAFEALNNASVIPNNLLIILNDNEMAIDKNVGGMSNYLLDISTSKMYNTARREVLETLSKYGIIKPYWKDNLARINNSIKAALTSQGNIFEGFNIRYFGPVDGHDIEYLVKVLDDLKAIKGPKVLHLKTKKGKGFLPAELSQTEWHAPGRFNADTGERILPPQTISPPRYQDVFGETIIELAEQNERIYGITPAMPTGSSLNLMMEKIPERSIDVGIAEQHAVTYAAGLAKEGMIPFCNIYSSFMQRAYDQLIHDVAIQQLQVVFCLDRGGLVGEDGPTHHGAFDLAYMRCIPNLIISSPLNEVELRNLMFTAQEKNHGAFSIRYPRGKGVTLDWKKPFRSLPIGKGECLKDGLDVAFVTLGPIGNTVTKVIEQLEQKGISCAHYNMIFLKPIDEELMQEVFTKHKLIISVEDGTILGGLGSALIELAMDKQQTVKIKRLGIPDHFIEHGSSDQLYHLYGLDVEGIIKKVIPLLSQTI